MPQRPEWLFAKVCDHTHSSFIFLLSIHRPDCTTGRAEERVAKLVDSPDRPETEASYKLEDGGWADV